jgi:uncharacterized membrane protein YhhN
MSIWFLAFFTFISAVLTIHARYKRPHSFLYLFKPLTMILILAAAWLADRSLSTAYQRLVLLGLLFSLSGDVFLMLPKDRFIPGLAAFLAAHLFYIAAFTGGAGFKLTGWILCAVLAAGIAIAVPIVPRAGRMKLPIILYVAVILTMVWQALERWNRMRTGQAGLAAAGAVLFLISDSLLAWNRFRRPFKTAEVFKLGSYFAAQWMIAMSIGH